MVTKILEWYFKQQTRSMIRRLMSENRLMFLNKNSLKYTDRANSKVTYSFPAFAKFIVSGLLVSVDSNKKINKMAKSMGGDVLSSIVIAGISEENVIEVLNEEYNKEKK